MSVLDQIFGTGLDWRPMGPREWSYFWGYMYDELGMSPTAVERLIREELCPEITSNEVLKRLIRYVGDAKLVCLQIERHVEATALETPSSWTAPETGANIGYAIG